jgi:D-glycero-D-manno-heptose 1,7-bisphosphate phosphatase
MRLVLMDRDGVLNIDRPDSVKSPDEFALLPRAGEAVARLNRAGVKVAVVTNQSIVGRGIVTQEMLARIHETMHAKLARSGARIDALLVAPDAPGSLSERRKPAPGMLREALTRFAAPAGESPMIGDAMRDLEAAAALGCPRILVRTGKGAATQAGGLPDSVLPVAVHDDLWDAVGAILDTSP